VIAGSSGTGVASNADGEPAAAPVAIASATVSARRVR
jgi:hypothetical protein